MPQKRTKLDDVNDVFIASLNNYRARTGRKPISKESETKLRACDLIGLGAQPSQKQDE